MEEQTYNVGNKHAMKFPTPESRKVLCEKYCDHLRSGLSKECFPECDPQTIRRYIIEYPNEFDTAQIERAEREGMLMWEQMGLDGSRGLIKGFNSLSWKFNLQNRFNWRDKREDDVKIREDGAKQLAHQLFHGRDDEEEGD